MPRSGARGKKAIASGSTSKCRSSGSTPIPKSGRAGRVALSRGPLIYCVEASDNDSRLHRLTLPRTAGIEAHEAPGLLGGVVTLSATARADAGDGWQDGLYRSEPPASVETRLTAIPYFAWDNR